MLLEIVILFALVVVVPALVGHMICVGDDDDR